MRSCPDIDIDRQSDESSLVLGPLNQLSRVIMFNSCYIHSNALI